MEEAMKTMDNVGVEIRFEESNIWIDGDLIDGGWKPTWNRLREKLKKRVKNQRVENYETKEHQSKQYRRQEQKCHVCLFQNLNSGKRQQL